LLLLILSNLLNDYSTEKRILFFFSMKTDCKSEKKKKKIIGNRLDLFLPSRQKKMRIT